MGQNSPADVSNSTIHGDLSFEEFLQAPSKDSPAWERIARAKRASRDAAIPQEWRLRPNEVQKDQLNVINIPAKCGILTARELEMTEMDVVLLVQKLLSREYSSYEVHSGTKLSTEMFLTRPCR